MFAHQAAVVTAKAVVTEVSAIISTPDGSACWAMLVRNEVELVVAREPPVKGLEEHKSPADDEDQVGGGGRATGAPPCA